MTDGEVTGLAVFTDEVTDLTPLTALPRLKHLSLRSKGYANGRLEDIGPLRHLRHLEKVSVAGTAVEDITPLAGLRLIGLNLFGTRVRDLSPLRGMPLNYLFIYTTPVTDLSPLAGMKMEGFSYDFTKIDRARALDLLRFLRDEMTIYREINDIAVAKVWKRLEAGEIP